MKNLMKSLIVLLMIAFITGISCKKEEVQPEPKITIFRVELKELESVGTHVFVTTILDTQDYEETGIYWNYGTGELVQSDEQKVTENIFDNPYVGEQHINPYWIGRGVYKFPVDSNFEALSIIAFAVGKFGTIYSDVEIISE